MPHFSFVCAMLRFVTLNPYFSNINDLIFFYGGWQRLAPPLRSLFFPALLGLITAAADESIQTFIPGRSGEFRDVLIDFSGICLGLLLILLASRLFRPGKDA